VDFKSLTESLSQSVSTQLLANIVVILGQRLERVRRGQEITHYHWLDETASKNSANPSDEAD
jgi:transcriptional regulatory protein LevR